MKKIIPNGTEVLIFHYIRNHNINVDETNFIKGVIISSKPSDDLAYHGSPWHVQIYTILGEDGNEYIGTYGSAYVGNFFIRTIDDHIKHIAYCIKENNEKMQTLKEKNHLLCITMQSLVHRNQKNKILKLNRKK